MKINQAHLAATSRRADADDLRFGSDLADVWSKRTRAYAEQRRRDFFRGECPIRCVETGITYRNASEAGRLMGIQPTTVRMAKHHGWAVDGRFHFVGGENSPPPSLADAGKASERILAAEGTCG